MRPTREGVRYLLATLLIGFASFNTGNNLIYLIFGLLLSVLAISFVALWLNLKGLDLEIAAGYPVFAGSRSPLRVTVHNSKAWLPSYSLEVGFPAEMLSVDNDVVVPVVAPKATESFECEASFMRRGRDRFGDITVSSGFPFIFFFRKVRAAIEGGAVVFPRLLDVEISSLESGDAGEGSTLKPGRSEDLLMIREFRNGDDPKHMSWKATAKMGSPMVREHAERLPRTVTIVLDNSAPADTDNFERAVSYAASIAWSYCNEGYRVRLSMCGAQIPFGTGV